MEKEKSLGESVISYGYGLNYRWIMAHSWFEIGWRVFTLLTKPSLS